MGDAEITSGAAFAAALSFRRLSDNCQFRNGNDCTEPTQDFNYLSCSPTNCPVLLRALIEIEGEQASMRSGGA